MQQRRSCGGDKRAERYLVRWCLILMGERTF